MTRDLEPGSSIPIASVPNMRDMGGWPAGKSGRVRRGLVYRSTELDRLAGTDMTTFERLDVRTVYDLRTPAERSAHPDRLPPGTAHVFLDILRDMPNAAPGQLFSVASDPKTAEEMLGDGKGLALFEAAYRKVVSLPSACEGYRRLFTDMAREKRRPLLFHCATGKDRTGWAAASLLMLLGVADELVMKEYLLTNAELIPAEEPILDHFKSLGGDPDILRPMLGVAPEYLQAALDEMHREFGTVESYFSEGLRIDKTDQDALRTALVEAA